MPHGAAGGATLVPHHDGFDRWVGRGHGSTEALKALKTLKKVRHVQWIQPNQCFSDSPVWLRFIKIVVGYNSFLPQFAVVLWEQTRFPGKRNSRKEVLMDPDCLARVVRGGCPL
jgi:hypothetical protein